MPEIEYAFCLRTLKPRSVYNISDTILKGFYQIWVLVWVIFKVGILNNDYVAYRMRNPGP
jgi:hypothetical protein